MYRITPKALEKTLFPLGNMDKTQVREEARERGLITAEKKDSVGICFVGKIGIKEFLKHYVEVEPGDIVDQHGNTVGEHDGALFYTIGQRHGLNVGGGLPYYVTGKDMDKNTVFVTSNLDDEKLWSDTITLSEAHWIHSEPEVGTVCHVRTRHLGELIEAECQNGGVLKLDRQVKALSPGQSAVIYLDDVVLGGGVISQS